MFKKVIFLLPFFLLFFSMAIFSSQASANSSTTQTPFQNNTFILTTLDPNSTSVTQSTYEIAPYDIGNPLYPGTNIEMMPGDIIYSPKNSWDSIIVGHVAIVGDDFRIYHVTPAEPYGRGDDSIENFLGRFNTNNKLTVLRTHYTSSQNTKAGKWARNNIDNVDGYLFNIWLSNTQYNYCSKFVWQAFFYGTNKDILGEDIDDNTIRYILPSEIKASDELGSYTSFYPN